MKEIKATEEQEEPIEQNKIKDNQFGYIVHIFDKKQLKKSGSSNYVSYIFPDLESARNKAREVAKKWLDYKVFISQTLEYIEVEKIAHIKTIDGK